MLSYVIDEILKFREKKSLFSKAELIPFKSTLFILSILIPFSLDIEIAVIYTLIVWLLTIFLGLKRTALYIVSSAAILYISMLLITLALNGNIHHVIRALLVATSTLSTGVIIFATTPPSHLRRFSVAYLLMITLNSVLKELRDIQIVLKARGETGFRYYLRIFVISIEIALSRIDVLIDSLKVRGIDISE
uniref:Uncharacterized protein n=1 Tax=Ignisphaera aggregans TaxID=334771 RepID=A0A7J3QGE2_9CREN